MQSHILNPNYITASARALDFSKIYSVLSYNTLSKGHVRFGKHLLNLMKVTTGDDSFPEHPQRKNIHYNRGFACTTNCVVFIWCTPTKWISRNRNREFNQPVQNTLLTLRVRLEPTSRLLLKIRTILHCPIAMALQNSRSRTTMVGLDSIGSLTALDGSQRHTTAGLIWSTRLHVDILPCNINTRSAANECDRAKWWCGVVLACKYSAVMCFSLATRFCLTYISTISQLCIVLVWFDFEDRTVPTKNTYTGY